MEARDQVIRRARASWPSIKMTRPFKSRAIVALLLLCELNERALVFRPTWTRIETSSRGKADEIRQFNFFQPLARFFAF
jgi:hypothetical protein